MKLKSLQRLVTLRVSVCWTSTSVWRNWMLPLLRPRQLGYYTAWVGVAKTRKGVV